MTPAGDPRLLSLANGLADLGGGSPLPQGPSEPATPPIQAPPSLTDLYMKARVAGMDDTNAALAVARHLRDQADLRSGFRDAGNVAAGRPLDLGYRQQLMGEADRPLQDLAAQRATAPLAMEEAKRRGELASADIGAQQAAQLRDPNHPTNIAMRQAFTRLGLTPPPGLTVAALPKEMWETVKPLAELTAKREGITAEAPLKAAETRKAGAEATKTSALTGPEIAKTSAEAAKTAAEGAVEAQKLGGQIAPGWVLNGTVGGVGEDEKKAFRTQVVSAGKASAIIDQLTGLLGKGDFVANPDKVAKAAVLANQLVLSSKEAAGIRGLPPQDVAFLEQMTGDFSTLNVKNLLGLSRNPTRLRTLKSTINSGLLQDAKTIGASPKDGNQTAPSGSSTNGRMIGKSGKPFEWVEGKGWVPASDSMVAVRGP